MNPAYKPSPEFIRRVSVLILIALIGGVVYFVVTDVRKKAEPRDAITFRASDKDRDGDGLKDWEEHLWRTDLRNTDTDGDGTPDGKEVEEDRDPLIKGPNDKVTPFQKKNLYQIPSAKSYTNKTTNLFNLTFPEMLKLVDDSINGKEVSRTQVEKITEAYAPRNSTTTKLYSLSDVTLQQKVDLLAYGNELKRIIDSYAPYVGDELELSGSGLSQQNENTLLSLRSSAIRYESLARDLVKVEVPSSLASAQLTAANAYARLSGVTIYLSALSVDPLQGLVAVRDYREASNDADIALHALLSQYAAKATGVQ